MTLLTSTSERANQQQLLEEASGDFPDWAEVQGIHTHMPHQVTKVTDLGTSQCGTMAYGTLEVTYDTGFTTVQCIIWLPN